MKYFLTALQKYADFDGRARRKEYWYFALFTFFFSIPFSILDIVFESTVPGLIFNLAILLPSLAVTVRRMHDVNKSGWFCLIPIYNLILTLTDGDKGPNRFGIDPKRPEFEEFLAEGDAGTSV